MRIDFVKMNGAGNDFIMIDDRAASIGFEKQLVIDLCMRRRGIGADGLIVIDNAEGADFLMRYYNRNGLEAEMCGNGARCAAYFASTLGIGRKSESGTEFAFETKAGTVLARVNGFEVSVGIGDARELSLNNTIELADGAKWKSHVVNTGVPHAVVPVTDAEAITGDKIMALGRAIRNHTMFEPNGTNVDFVSIGGKNRLIIRTYERGVEQETLACGTGSIAAAVVMAGLEKAIPPVEVLTRGGEKLVVDFALESYGASAVTLTGPVALNFAGTIDL